MIRPFNKTIVEGELEFTTAMRIGGPTDQYSTTKAPLLRTPEGLPYIPGSSMKGVFRSTVERFVAGLGGRVWTCLLEDERCPGTQGKAQQELYRRRSAGGITDKELAEQAAARLCDTCKLFGSPFFASKVAFDDLYLLEGESGIIERRDGVSIHRDSGRAADRRKFDFEATAPGQRFGFRLTLENANDVDRALIAVGLTELMSGSVRIGGYTSRGLGACRLNNVCIYHVDFDSPDPAERLRTLRRYLTNRELKDKMTQLDPSVLNEWLDPLFADVATAGGLEGARHA